MPKEEKTKISSGKLILYVVLIVLFGASIPLQNMLKKNQPQEQPQTPPPVTSPAPTN